MGLIRMCGGELVNCVSEPLNNGRPIVIKYFLVVGTQVPVEGQLSLNGRQVENAEPRTHNRVRLCFSRCFPPNPRSCSRLPPTASELVPEAQGRTTLTQSRVSAMRHCVGSLFRRAFSSPHSGPDTEAISCRYIAGYWCFAPCRMEDSSYSSYRR